MSPLANVGIDPIAGIVLDTTHRSNERMERVGRAKHSKIRRLTIALLLTKAIRRISGNPAC